MRRRDFRLMGTVAAVLACAVLAGAEEERRVEVPSKEIGSKYVIVGALGKPLGTYMTVSGVRYTKPILMGNPFLVDVIDEGKLHGTVLVEVQGGIKALTDGRHVFRGYENGAMVSSPVEPGSTCPVPQASYHFGTWFVVTAVKQEPAGATSATEPAPSGETLEGRRGGKRAGGDSCSPRRGWDRAMVKILA